MLARIRKATEEKDSGFTLIELLVVMIIIGILAAIAIPAFLNQKTKAKETSAKSDVTTIGKEMAAYFVDGQTALFINSSAAGGNWQMSAGTAATTPFVATGKLSSGNTASGTAVAGGATYCVQVKNADAPTTWKYTETGLDKGTCTA